MADWIKCTLEPEGDAIHLNLSAAMTIRAARPGTRIAFAGGLVVAVRETAEQLLKLRDQASALSS